MIKVVELNKIYQAPWDDYVKQHHEATPYHRMAWLQSIEQAYGFQPKAWLALGTDDKVVGVLPTTLLKVPFLGVKLSALPYCDAGGVLADDDAIRAVLLAHAFDFMAKQGIAKFEHRMVDLSKSQAELESQSKVRMLLDLPESSEALFASFKSKLRSQIRKAEKNGLTAQVGQSNLLLDGFYQVYARNMRDLGSPAHSRSWFDAVVAHYKDDVVIANVYKDDVVVGAGLVIINGERCSIPWASTNADYNRLAPNMLLYWSLLSHVADLQISQFDFGRSTPGEGTFKFKRQWGAEPSGLNWCDYHHGEPVAESQSGDSANGQSKIRHTVERIWRKLPVNIATSLGGRIRKYISL